MKYIIMYILSINIAYCNYTDRQLSKLDSKLRSISNCRLVVSSGYRSYAKNKLVGGSKDSYHMKDMARDVVKSGPCDLSYTQIGYLARPYFKGIIVYKNHLHVDTRKKEYFYIAKGVVF